MNEKQCLKYMPEYYLSKQIGKRIYLFNIKTKLAFSLLENEFNVLTSFTVSDDVEEIYNKVKNIYSKEELLKLIEDFIKIGAFNYQTQSKRTGFNISIYFNNFFHTLKINKLVLYILIFLIINFIFILNIFSNNIISYNEIITRLYYTSYNKIIYCFVIITICILSIFLHEMSHAIIGSIENVFVPEITFSLNFLFFKAHTTIIGIDTIKNNGNKIIIYIAGNLMHFFLINIGLLLKQYPFISIAIVFPNLILLMFNLSIFLKSDINKILSLYYETNFINLYKALTGIVTFLTVVLLLLFEKTNLLIFEVIFMIIAIQAFYSLILTVISCIVKYLFKSYKNIFKITNSS